jgi:hypothetical protein
VSKLAFTRVGMAVASRAATTAATAAFFAAFFAAKLAFYIQAMCGAKPGDAIADGSAGAGAATGIMKAEISGFFRCLAPARSSRRCGYGFVNRVLRLHSGFEGSGEVSQIFKRVQSHRDGLWYGDTRHR